MKKSLNPKKEELLQMDQKDLERLSGKFADSDNHAPNFPEELSDGGERNKMAEAQRERIKND